MRNSKKFPTDSTEFLVINSLNELISRCKEKIYTPEFKASPEFKTEQTDIDTLGIIISKYCEWDGALIKDVAMSAFEDSNFHKAKISLY